MTFNTYFAVFNAQGEIVHQIDWLRTAKFYATQLGKGAYVMSRAGQKVFTV